MNNPPYWPNPNDPNDSHSQPTTAGPYPQFPPPGQSYPQWSQQPPPPYPQPGQFGPPPGQIPPQKEWYQKPLGIILTLIFFFPLGLYLMWKYATWPKSAKWVVTAVLLTFGMCGAIANAAASSQQATQPVAAATAQPTTVVLSADDKLATVRALMPLPTPAPTPTATPTPVPTQPPVVQQPVQQPATQSQPVQSAPAPATTGVYGNPWGYDFTPGTVITSPASGFCNGTYFSCIQSFSSGQGYVMECGDELYSKSGGRSGSCSRHGGDKATLYQHP